MTWWQIIFIILAIPVIYITYINLTGKKRRDEIIKSIITDSYFSHYNQTISLTGVLQFEAVQEFARENDGYVKETYVTVETNIDNEEIYTRFEYDSLNDTIEIISMNMEDEKKDREAFMKDYEAGLRSYS